MFNWYCINIPLRFTVFQFCETSFWLQLWFRLRLWLTDTTGHDEQWRTDEQNNDEPDKTWQLDFWISTFLDFCLSGYLQFGNCSAFDFFSVTLQSWFCFRINCWTIDWILLQMLVFCWKNDDTSTQILPLLTMYPHQLEKCGYNLAPMSLLTQSGPTVFFSHWCTMRHRHYCSYASTTRLAIFWTLPPENWLTQLIWTLFKDSSTKTSLSINLSLYS